MPGAIDLLCSFPALEERWGNVVEPRRFLTKAIGALNVSLTAGDTV
jgi:hypothetical protein